MSRRNLSSRERKILGVLDELITELRLIETASIPERSNVERGSIAASWSLPGGIEPRSHLDALAQTSLRNATTVRDWLQSTAHGFAPAHAWKYREEQERTFISATQEVAAKLRALGTPATETLALADSIRHGIEQFTTLRRRSREGKKSVGSGELPEDITLGDVRDIVSRLDRGFREATRLFGELRDFIAERGTEPRSEELDDIEVGADSMDDRAYHACIEYVDRIRTKGDLRGSFNSALVEFLSDRSGERSSLTLNAVVEALNQIRRRDEGEHVIGRFWQLGQELYVATFVAGFFLGEDETGEALLRRCRIRGLYLCRFGQMLEELYDPAA